MSLVTARIEANLERVRERIAQAARRSGRNADAVTLVAVTKTVGIEEMAALYALGVRHFGENRTDVARSKRESLSAPAQLHMIGTVQRRRARDVAELFDWVHSVDRLEVAETLERHAAERDRTLSVFVEANVSGEASKHGFAPEALAEAAERVRGLAHLDVRGLMTMAPFEDDPERTRPVFAALRREAERLGLSELSMGMSNDFEVAVEEGATHVRIGTALFA